MVLLGQTVVSFFDLGLGAVFGHPQRVVVILAGVKFGDFIIVEGIFIFAKERPGGNIAHAID